ncbi:COG4149 ABC-type molybdate transport system [Vibrio sp. B1REV9]|nr:COG4149 ABC-type molybdate transport system [Vibrio sp. B1REV9]
MTDLEYQALMLSLKVGGYAVIWLIPLGVALAWILSRKSFVGKSVLDSLIHLPLVLPPVVIGYLLLISLGRQGFMGSWLYEHFGLVFSFNWKGAVVACIVVALPLMVRSVRLSLDNVDPKLEHAASTLGASPIKVFFYHHITVNNTGYYHGDDAFVCTQPW